MLNSDANSGELIIFRTGKCG